MPKDEDWFCFPFLKVYGHICQMLLKRWWRSCRYTVGLENQRTINLCINMVKLLLYKRKNLSMLKNFIADGIIYGLSPWALIICTLLYNHQSIINNIIFLKIKRSILGHLLQSLAIPIANFITLFVDYRNQMICFLKSKYDDGKSLCEKVKWVVISFLETLKNILCIQKPKCYLYHYFCNL